MPEIKNNFIQGKMNKDLDDRILPNGQYRDANNITVSKSENSDVGTVQNIKGNEYAEYTTSLGFSEVSFSSRIDTSNSISISGDNTAIIKPNMFVRGLRNSASIGQGDIENKYDIRKVTSVSVSSGNTIVNVSPTGFNSVGNQDGSGNAKEGDTLFFSFNLKTIGYYADPLTGDVFYFVTNFTPNNINDDSSAIQFADNTFICRIYYKNIKNPNINPPVAIIDSKRLNFSTLHNIININRIDDLLFWTDNYNQPRRINITDAIANEYTDDIYLEDKISVAQYAPYTSPKVTMEYDATIKSKHIEEEFVKFAYRFKYHNNEYSLISPFTQHTFHPGKPTQTFNDGTYSTSGVAMAGIMTNEDMENAVKESIVENMVNKANKITLDIILPFDDNITNHASAKVNNGSGLTGDENHAIDTVSGTIAANNILLTSNDDLYTVEGNITSSDFDTTTAITPTIADNTNLYFFNIGSSPQYSWENKLKIKEIEILYTESDSTAIKVVDRIKIPQSNFNIKPTVEVIKPPAIVDGSPVLGIARLRYKHQYVYKSTKPLKTLPEADIIRVSDIIPIKAKTQEVSGNRIIYGNFLQNRSINNVINTSKLAVSTSGQAAQNKQYLLSSIKSGRTYSVGVVLSDRYGRQSPVILPSNSTTFSERKSSNVDVSHTNWNHNCLRLSFNEALNDAYNNDINSNNYNPLGWYSYRIVVKQTEQDYYNVYTPQVFRASQTLDPEKTYVYLNGDNINKVPRDVNESSTETGIAGSNARLLPVIIDETINQSPSNRFDGLAVNRFPEFINVGSIGTAREFNLTQDISSNNANDSNKVLEAIFKSKNDPLLAQLPERYPISFTSSNTGGTLVGDSHSNFASAVGLNRAGFSFNVFETFPFISAIDIYFETSSCGLIADLNEQINESLTDVPVSQTLSANTVLESANSGTAVGSLVTTNGVGTLMNGQGGNSSVSHTIKNIVDGTGAARVGTFSISNQNIVTASTFDFKNDQRDNYVVTVTTTKVGASDSKDFTYNIAITNVAPSINVGPIGQANNTNNTTGRTINAMLSGNSTGLQITGINGGKADATRGLNFSIVSQTNAGRYIINSTTGLITAGVELTNGMDDTLTLKVTDLNGAGLSSPNTTLRILVQGTVLVAFYRAQSGNSVQSTAGDEPTGVVAYFKRESGANKTQPTPDEGDIVYTDSAGTNPFSTGCNNQGFGGLFFSMNGPNFAGPQQALFTFKSSSDGVVRSKQPA